MTKNVTTTLRVNGEELEARFPPHKTLLEVLREELDLTGTKHGCELGECGTCTVLLDGTPMLSCLTLALECEGKQITTIEGALQSSTPRLQMPTAEHSPTPQAVANPSTVPSQSLSRLSHNSAEGAPVAHPVSTPATHVEPALPAAHSPGKKQLVIET